MTIPFSLPQSKSRKGDDRIAKILDATLELLSEKGYAEITLGQVARHVGIATGHLQYYFPSRDDLLRSALTIQLDDLKTRWSEVAEAHPNDPWARLFAMIDQDIELSRSPDRIALALEKWAYATRDAEANRISKGWFEWIVDAHADTIAELRPDLDDTSQTQLATLVVSLLHGIWPFFGAAKVRKSGLENYDSVLKQNVRIMITNFDPTTGD